MKYYAIKDDVNHEIVDSWDLCKEHLKNYTKPQYKSFKTKEEAEAYLSEMDNMELDEDALDNVAGGMCYSAGLGANERCNRGGGIAGA